MNGLNGLKVLNDKAHCAWLLEEVKRRGGLTLNNSLEVIEYENGYQVGGALDVNGVAREIIIHNLNGFNGDKLYYYIMNIIDTIKDNQYIGLWLHENKLYIELSEKIDDFLTAFNVAQVRKQKAIFDWSNKTDIKTDWIDKTFNELKTYLDTLKLDSENYITLGDNVAYSIMTDNNEVYCDCEEEEATALGINEAFKKAPIKGLRVNINYYSDIDYQKALIYIHI